MKPRLSARFLFAALGAAGCLLAALALEGFYARAHTSSWISHDGTSVLLFFPHIRNDMERRLREANASSGDVEITLTWDNLNDLDLHCIDPNEDHIYYATTPETQAQAVHKTAGVLDVDQNRGPTYTQHPVEHIVYQRGQAPEGRYQVFVDHFGLHGGSDPTKYQVTVKEYDRIHHYSGQISHSSHRPDGLSTKICEFTTRSSSPFGLGLPAGFWRALLVILLWAAVIAAALCAALLAGLYGFYRRVYRQRFLAPGKWARIAIVGALWAAFGGALAQTAFAFAPADFLKLHPTWAHVAGLAILAFIAGTALGKRVPHLKRGWAFLAGLIGGALAGWLFMVVYLRFGESMASEMGARVTAAAVIGALIGFAIELIVEEPEEPETPIEFEDDALDGMQPLSLRANRIGPAGKLRRAGREPVHH